MPVANSPGDTFQFRTILQCSEGTFSSDLEPSEIESAQARPVSEPKIGLKPSAHLKLSPSMVRAADGRQRGLWLVSWPQYKALIGRDSLTLPSMKREFLDLTSGTGIAPRNSSWNCGNINWLLTHETKCSTSRHFPIASKSYGLWGEYLSWSVKLVFTP